MHDPHVLIVRIVRFPITPKEWRRALRLGEGPKKSGWMRLPTFAEVWHREPEGRDSFDVCSRGARWEWHVHHWRVVVVPWRHLRRWLFRRCDLCGRRHQWSASGFKIGQKIYHYHCSQAVSLQQDLLAMTETLDRLLRNAGIGSRDELRAAVEDPGERRNQSLLWYGPWRQVELYRDQPRERQWRAPNEHITGR